METGYGARSRATEGEGRRAYLVEGAKGCDMALRRYRGRRGRRRAWISAHREDVRAVAAAEGCDIALRRHRGRRGRRREWISAYSEDVRAVAAAEGYDMALRRHRGRRR